MNTLLALCEPDQAVFKSTGDTLRVLKVSRRGDILVVIFSMHKESWLSKGKSQHCRTKLAALLATRRPNPCLIQHLAAFIRLSSRPLPRISPRASRHMPSTTLHLHAQRKPISSGYCIRPFHSLPPIQRYCSVSTQSHEVSFEQPHQQFRNSASLPVLAAR